MVALVGFFPWGGRYPAIVCAAPGGGVVDLFLRIYEAEGLRKVLGENGYGVAG